MDNHCTGCGKETGSGYYSEGGKFLCQSCHSKTKPDCFACKECGTFDAPSNWAKDTLRKDLCHGCSFWMKYVWIGAELPVVRIKGEHYYIEKDINPEQQAFRGFGGAKFGIAFNDGRIVISHNLWSQGTIPIHFRDRLPDNAVFLSQNQIERLEKLGVI